MSSDDGSRRRRQAFQGAVSPAGVGTSVSNQVSPDTLQELEAHSQLIKLLQTCRH